jgi:hypothetical protein
MADKKSKSQTLIYPDQGELIQASPTKKSGYLVFFVHFLNGHKKALKRHVQLVNELGYDAYIFNLKDDFKDHNYIPYSSRTKKIGLKHVIADQIQDHLNLFPQYKNKMVFAFSNIAGCAIEAMVRRLPKENDIHGLICDSGPGMSFLRSSYNLFKYEFKMQSFLLRAALTTPFALAWSPQMNSDIHDDLEKLPDQFPILSIRGWRDQLISVESINAVFEPHGHLKWKKLNLPEAVHITGLRDFPNEYKPPVIDFLEQFIAVAPLKAKAQ